MIHQKLVVLSAVFAVPLLCPAQETGSLCVKAHPGRAGVFLDGKYLGPAANFRVARTYSVPAGDHEVKLVDPRYEELTTKVAVKAGKKTTLHETLKEMPPPKPPFGRLRTESTDKFAAVYCKRQIHGSCGRVQQFRPGAFA